MQYILLYVCEGEGGGKCGGESEGEGKLAERADRLGSFTPVLSHLLPICLGKVSNKK